MKLVVFSGAGVSADSGIATFRDADGLWEQYRIEDVCTPEALTRDRKTVIRFYNLRRKELLSTKPNPAHYAIKELERYYEAFLDAQLLIIAEACESFDKRTAKKALAALQEKKWWRNTRNMLDDVESRLLHSEFEEAARVIREFLRN